MAGTSNYISHLWDVITCPFPWCLLLAQHLELWLGLYDANNYRVWWRHCVGALPHYCPFVREIHWSLVDPCLKWPVRRSFAVFWIVCLNRLLNKRSKCWRSETQLCTYDVSLMKLRELIVHVHIVFGVAFGFIKYQKCLLSNHDCCKLHMHYNDIIMSAMSSQITSLTIVYSTVYSGADEKTPKLRVTGLCEREFSGDPWIPFTKDQ